MDRNEVRLLISFAFIALTNVAFSISPHPVSISWIAVDLQDDRVVMNVKISVEDLIYFHDLSMDENQEMSQKLLLNAAKKHISVLKKGITISDENDLQITGEFIKSNFSSLTKPSYHVMDLVRPTLHYQFNFELPPALEFITFGQQFTAVPAISFLSISKNGNELISQKELKSNEPFTIKRDATSIGSSDQSNFMLSYFSISDTKVTHEITLPIALLQSYIQLKAVENIETIEQFIRENSSLEVDQLTIEPEIESLSILNGDLNQSSSIVNLRIAYSLQNVPNKIVLEWKHFNWKMRWFESIIDAFGQEEKHTFSRFKTEKEIERESLEIEKN